jgi:CPA2 family monovalent cation:H+ antiporter-2
VIFLGAAVLLARYGNTPLLHAVARTRSRELFTLTAFGICAAVALIAEGMQLSLALGAFAAGLVLSESIYSHRIMGDIQPFKDLFLTIFFISVGLMIDLSVVASDFGIIVAGTVVLMGVKALIVRGVARFLGMGWRSGWMGAVSLASTGEFSLVLMRKAGAIRPFDPRLEQILLACTVLSMAAVPALLRWVRSFSETRSTPRLPDLDPRHPRTLREHAIICGYGPVGCRLNEALRLSGVSTLVLDLNADTVRRLRNEGQPVLFADASHFEALQLAGVEHARLVAFTFPAVAVTLAALPEVRERNAGIVVFARAKFEGDAEALRERDVRVIHDERESAVAMIESVFCVYENAGLTREEILRVTDGSRSGR